MHNNLNEDRNEQRRYLLFALLIALAMPLCIYGALHAYTKVRTPDAVPVGAKIVAFLVCHYLTIGFATGVFALLAKLCGAGRRFTLIFIVPFLVILGGIFPATMYGRVEFLTRLHGREFERPLFESKDSDTYTPYRDRIRLLKVFEYDGDAAKVYVRAGDACVARDKSGRKCEQAGYYVWFKRKGPRSWVYVRDELLWGGNREGYSMPPY